jgi:fructosamine-3-kinase
VPDVHHDIPFFTKLLQQVFSGPIKIIQAAPVGGGDIHHSYQVTLADNRCYFIKCNYDRYCPLLEQEHYALAALNQAGAIAVPDVHGMGSCEGFSYLVLEWLALYSAGDEAAMGRQLAQLHQHGGERFGWANDNFIGYSKQQNIWCARWSDFWRDYRLLPQLTAAVKQGVGRSLSEYVDDFLAASDSLLKNHNPRPSLLHGDLWGGNKAYLATGKPVIFDPACYYGDPEVDVAFTRLFGGFGQDFYTAYYQANNILRGGSLQSTPDEVAQRVVLYNSYHQLNHLNLFGEGYLADCQSAMVNVIQSAR